MMILELCWIWPKSEKGLKNVDYQVEFFCVCVKSVNEKTHHPGAKTEELVRVFA